MTVDTGPAPARRGAISGYSLILPPGWTRIPLRKGTEDAVREVAAETIAYAPEEIPRDDVARFRAQFEGRLLGLARKAAENSGIDLYLPTMPRGEVATPCSIVVSEFRLQVGEGMDPVDVARQLAEGGDAERAVEHISVEGGIGTRSEHVRPADPAKDVNDAARVVDYTIPVPGDPARWLSASFSTPGDGDAEGEFALLLVELFDAIMTTFTWQRRTDG
ncbi:hypothetical protein AB0P36_21905 [Streptomyces flavidovirens]|uniref:hypothetical protein n=1 Tax=Streptomyces flavidovirens TaxID=67298 RepID=UPI00342C395E